VRLLVRAGAREVGELVPDESFRGDRVAVEVDREQLGRGGELRDVGVARTAGERSALGEPEQSAAGDERQAAPCAAGQELRSIEL
jgi:hypothetical protein